MKVFPTVTPFSDISENKFVGVAICRWVPVGISFGDTDHFGIVILGLFVGLVFWTDREWEIFQKDEK